MSVVGELSGVILAAGLSRRAAPANKLLVEVDGQPVVRRVAGAFCEAGLREVIVVTGHQSGRIQEALRGLAVRFVEAPDRGCAASMFAASRGGLPRWAGGGMSSRRRVAGVGTPSRWVRG
jgi:molybdenum cofactor cytidylyltransferase